MLLHAGQCRGRAGEGSRNSLVGRLPAAARDGDKGVDSQAGSARPGSQSSSLPPRGRLGSATFGSAAIGARLKVVSTRWASGGYSRPPSRNSSFE